MGQLFDSMMRGYAPITTGREVRLSTGLEGLPFMEQSGVGGLAAQLLAGPALQGMMGQQGMTPFGLGHDQNVYDLLRRRQFTLLQQESMQQAAEKDRDGYMRTFRGLAAMTGTPWGSQQRQAARSLSDSAVQFSPILAQIAPDLLDQMGGMRGSAAVMAQRMSVGSRYRVDPLTGRMGYSADTIGQSAKQLYKDLYEDGDLAAMKGISAGQLGGMYDEFTRRGMLSGQQGSLSFRTLQAAQGLERTDRSSLERAAANQGVKLPGNLADLRIEDLDKLRGDSGVSDKLRSFDSDKIKRSLKSYVDVVSAMRDIFGDMGRPNAPMGELIAGLEAMTQGGVGKIDTGRLNMMVRTTHELAKQSGVSLDTAMLVQQHAANRAEALGINPLHAVQATQGTLAWGSAFKAQGGASVPAWDRFNADQMTQLDTNLRVQAAASEQANRLGAFMRVNERVGGFQEGSAAQAMAKAVAAGQTEWLNPNTGKVQSTAMAESDFTKLMMSAKGRGGAELRLSEGDIVSMMRERASNEEAIHKFGIADQVRRQQSGDTQQWIASKVKNSLRDRLMSAGMSADEAAKAAEQSAGNIVGRVSKLSHEEFADMQTRTSRMSDIMRDELNSTKAGEYLTKQGLGKEFHDLTAELTYSGVNNMIQNDPRLSGFRSWQNIHATMHEGTIQRGDQNKMQARFTGEVAEALSPLGRGTPLQRAVQYLQDAGPKASIPELISQALGGVKNSEVNKAMQAPLVSVQKAQAQLEELHSKYLAATTSPERERLLQQITAQQNTLKANVSSLTTLAEKQGIATDQEALTVADTSNAKKYLRQVAIQTQDLHGLRGNFGPENTNISLVPEKSEIESILTAANKGKNDKDPNYMSVAQAETIAVARRRAQRMGISEQDIAAARKALPGAAEDRVIDRAFQERYVTAQEVSQKSIDEFLAKPGNNNIDRKTAKEAVHKEREQENKTRWYALWNSDSGAQFRESTELMMNSVNDVATKAIMSEKQMSKLGPLAIEKYQQLRGHEARLRTLAMYHTNSDMARLFAGDFNNDMTVDERAQLRHEVHSIQNQFGASLNFFETGLGKAGRNWGNSDEVARKILNLPKTGAIAATSLSAANEERVRNTVRAIETSQDGAGADRLARDLLKLPEGTLKPAQQADLDKAIKQIMNAQQTGSSETTARELLGLPQDQRANLARTKRGVETAQKLDDTIVTSLRDRSRIFGRLQDTAQAYGLSQAEMTKLVEKGVVPAGKTAAGFTPLSEAESQAIKSADEAYRRYSEKRTDIKDKIADIDRTLADKSTPADVQRTLEKQKAELVIERDKTTDKMKQVMSPVDPIAAARGVSSIDLVYNRKGSMTTATRDGFKSDLAAYRKLEADLAQKAKDLKIEGGVKGLSEGYAVLTKVDEDTKKFQKLEDTDTASMVKNLFQSYGLDTTKNAARITAVSNEMKDDVGRTFVRQLIGTGAQLRDVAKRGLKNRQGQLDAETKPGARQDMLKEAVARLASGPDDPMKGVVAMAKEFEEINNTKKESEREAKIRQFRTDYGIRSDDEFSQVKNALRFQTRKGILGAGDRSVGDDDKRAEKIVHGVDTMRKNNELGYNSQLSEDQWREMKLSGELTLRGEVADVNARGEPGATQKGS